MENVRADTKNSRRIQPRSGGVYGLDPFYDIKRSAEDVTRCILCYY